MQKILQYPTLLRSVKPQHLHSTSTSTFSSLSDGTAVDNLNISNEVLSLINSTHPIEPHLAKLAPFLNREVVISVLRSQAESRKDPRICFRFFNWAAEKDRFRSGVSHKLILDMLLRGENGDSFDLYWGVLDELRNEKMPVYADAFVVLILGYWRLRKAEKAVETFGRMGEYDCRPNVAAYNVILHVCVKNNVIMLALAVYNVMLKANLRMGCDTFSVMIDGLCKSGRTQDALNLFDEMTERGILPNRITYTVIMSGLCKAKRTHDAHRLFNLMKSSGCSPNSATYNALLDGFCKFAQIDEALMLFKSFRDEGYHVGIKGFSCVIDGLIRAKKISEAEELFKKVSSAGLEPDLVLYTIMIRGLCESKRMQDAVNMLRDMTEKGVKPDTQCYNVLIKGFCDVGMLDKAQSLELEISSPNTCTKTILICGMCKNGLLEKAEEIFKNMEKHGCLPSVVTFNALIDGLCKAGKLKNALLKLCEMEIGKNQSVLLRFSQGSDRVHDSESLQRQVEEWVGSGSILKAYKCLMQLADSGAVPNIKTYNTLINGMCKAGDVDGSLNLFNELRRKGPSPDSVTYSTLVNGLHRARREVEANELFEQMNENGCKPTSSVYKTLMTWSCKLNKTSNLFRLWLKYLKNVEGREEKSLKLAEEYFEKGESEKAVRALLEMETKSRKIFDSAPYNMWLIGLCQVDKVDEALRMFSLLEEFSVVISAPGCVKLIEALCSEGRQLEKAVEVFNYTMERGYMLMPRIINRLLQVLLVSRDESVLAFELVDRMKSRGYDLSSDLHHSTKCLLSRDYYGVRETRNVSAG